MKDMNKCKNTFIVEGKQQSLEKQLAIKKGELARMLLQFQYEREKRMRLEEQLRIKKIELKRTLRDLEEANTALGVLLERVNK